MLQVLEQVWPVSTNDSGTEFCLAAENEAGIRPFYLQVSRAGVQAWDALASNWLTPAYVGDALARVTYTGFPTLTYQIELGNSVVYTGTAYAYGAYMPLRHFSAWDGHWVLEVDDHLILDGRDLGQALGYDAVFGFALLGGQPFYFFEQDGVVRLSFAGPVLPHAYDLVIHNRCCEAAIHNVETGPDAVWFHALRNGTWYFVEVRVAGE